MPRGRPQITGVTWGSTQRSRNKRQHIRHLIDAYKLECKACQCDKAGCSRPVITNQSLDVFVLAARNADGSWSDAHQLLKQYISDKRSDEAVGAMLKPLRLLHVDCYNLVLRDRGTVWELSVVGNNLAQKAQISRE